MDGLYSTSQRGGVGQTVHECMHGGLSRGMEQVGSFCVCICAGVFVHGLGGTTAMTGTKPSDNMSRLARSMMQSGVNVHTCT